MSKVAVNNQQSYVLGDVTWIGMDTRIQPNKLKDGYAQNIENMMIDGNSPVLRNGFRGIMNTFVANPVYELTALKSSATVSKLVYAKTENCMHLTRPQPQRLKPN